jgi:CHAD domain-containing protein
MLDERVTTLLDALPAARAGDVRSVHQARVASRRLREMLPVARACGAARGLGRLQRHVERMTRALGPVRELDVAIMHLDALTPHATVSAQALAEVRQAIIRERLRRRHGMLGVMKVTSVEKLRRSAAAIRVEVPVSSSVAVAAAARRVARRASRLGAAMDRAAGLYLPDRLHAVRVAAKKLRYALEIARELNRSRATARIAQLKRVQDLLGRMHDHEILIDRTRQSQAALARRHRRLAVELGHLVRALEDACRQDHATYMKKRPALMQLCETLVSASERRPSDVA